MGSPAYDLSSIRLPRVAGRALRAFVALIESPATGWMFRGRMLRQTGVARLRRSCIDEQPTYLPLHPPRARSRQEQPSGADLAALAARTGDAAVHWPSIADYAAAYAAGVTTPVEVAERAIAAIVASNARVPPLRAIIASDAGDLRAQARASAERIRTGNSRGVLEGVPVAVKDELDAVPYPTKVGTRFMGDAPATRDATVVARVRAAGALIIGKANMHEIGIGVTGHNPHHGTARNPYDPSHYAGGSSSGPAVATAAGLCPGAIGADGGGSIRIPSALCGLVGLKTTFGRTSSAGAAPLTWSNDQVGPIAACACDAAILYAVMAGPDPQDPNTLGQPGISLKGFEQTSLEGISLGVYWPWFEHASPSVVTVSKKMLRALEALGARVLEVSIPGLDAARIAHLVTIVSEMLTAQQEYVDHWNQYSLDVRVNLALARALTAQDYLQALRVRTWATGNFLRALREVDAIVTPATACSAPRILPDALPYGESDLATLAELMRFVTAANLTGLPAIAFPAGYDSQGLPLGFQAMGRPWGEDILLRIARAAETVVERRRPGVCYDLLDGE